MIMGRISLQKISVMLWISGLWITGLVLSYPDYLGCKYNVQNEVIMGSETRYDPDLIVQFKVNGEIVPCNMPSAVAYSSDADIQVVHNLNVPDEEGNSRAEYFINVEGAEFKKFPLLHCPTRLYHLGSRGTFADEDAKIVNIKSVANKAQTGPKQVKVYGAMAHGYSTVRHSATCTLNIKSPENEVGTFGITGFHPTNLLQDVSDALGVPTYIIRGIIVISGGVLIYAILESIIFRNASRKEENRTVVQVKKQK